MSTFVQYSDGTSQKPVPIGYVKERPEDALIELMPNFHVVDYCGIVIPSRMDNLSRGLTISRTLGAGFRSVDSLKQSDLFKICKHEPFTEKRKSRIAARMMSRYRLRGPMDIEEAERYAFVLEVLGRPMSPNNLMELANRNKRIS